MTNCPVLNSNHIATTKCTYPIKHACIKQVSCSKYSSPALLDHTNRLYLTQTTLTHHTKLYEITLHITIFPCTCKLQHILKKFWVANWGEEQSVRGGVRK